VLLCRVEHAYLALAQSLTEFFSAASAAEKTHCQGEVYKSERGIPMWRTGYEQCGVMRYLLMLDSVHNLVHCHCLTALNTCCDIMAHLSALIQSLGLLLKLDKHSMMRMQLESIKRTSVTASDTHSNTI
jgi:hypothetical protein